MREISGIKIASAPYVCTFPRKGLQAITCYPDAQIFSVNGNKYGYSKKENTLIVTSMKAERAMLEYNGEKMVLRNSIIGMIQRVNPQLFDSRLKVRMGNVSVL